MNYCNICKKNNKLQSFFDFGLFPYANFPVNFNKFKNYLQNRNVNTKLSEKLNLQFCSSCNYLQLNKIPNNKILNDVYENFYTYPSPLKYNFNPTRDNFFLKILNNFLNKHNVKNVLEIGCYDGYILKQLQKQGYDVIGCEPSKGALIGKKFNIDIINNFYNKKLFLNKKFDLVILRHTLEHITNLDKILNDIIYVMHKKSILSIEVPNIEFYIKKGLLEVFSLQHIHYFSSRTFEIIANKFNLKIVKISKTPENIVIFFKKKTDLYKKSLSLVKTNRNKIIFNNFKIKINKNKFEINKIINNYKKDDLVFWGAGGFFIAATYLYKLPIFHNTFLVDGDKAKQGLFFYEHKIKINQASLKIVRKKKLIIITSYYSNQIIEDIKKMKIKIDILQIFPIVKLIKLQN